ncbi:membrane cofactor protein-like isoform X6 [Odocoileus virginianus]|uniref:Membrane cofactor protein n=1 Tax=Odocoileus virginianus TaxID=9874 RepID=A0A6J0YV09_ODOVR
MRASCAARKAPLRLPERLASSGRFVGVLPLALLLLLPTSSDACGDPPQFVTMKPKGAFGSSYKPGDEVLYECRLGFQPITPGQVLSVICQNDTTWSSLQEACKRRRCPTLGDPINGQVTFVNESTEFGSQAHYVCNKGYYLAGPSISYCEISAEGVDWSDNPPTCERIKCKPPEAIQNGKYTNSDKETFDYNEVVTYSCNPSNGPDEYSLIGESKLTCIGNDEWSSQPPQCKVVRCVYPIVEHGMIVSGFGPKYYYKATVVFKCSEGFNLQGDSTVVCGVNSTWEPELPKCIKDSKPTSPTMTSGHPEYPSPTDASPPNDAQGLGAGYIVLIIVAAVALGIGLLFCLYYCLCRQRKKGKAECSATYSTYQDKAVTSTE